MHALRGVLARLAVALVVMAGSAFAQDDGAAPGSASWFRLPETMLGQIGGPTTPVTGEETGEAAGDGGSAQDPADTDAPSDGGAEETEPPQSETNPNLLNDTGTPFAPVLDGPQAPPAAGQGAISDLEIEIEGDWRVVADRAIEAIAAGRASTPALEDLRSELAIWREEFLAQQSADARRIQTVRAQLEALGEAVGEGEEEPATITARRDALEAELAELRAPGALASEAYAEANGLIAEIDALVRERQAARFMERDSSPLSPAAWGPAFTAASEALRSMRTELSDSLNSPARMTEMRQTWGATAILLVIALILLSRGRRWTGWLEGLVRARTSRGRGVWTFILSLGQVILPFLGLVALAAAVISTGLLGRRLIALVSAIPIFGLYPIVAYWLGYHLQSSDPDSPLGPLGLTPEARTSLTRQFRWMGWAVAAASLVAFWTDISGITGASASALLAPFGLTVSVMLFTIGRIFLTGRAAATARAEGEDSDAAEVPRGFRDVLLALLGRLLIVDVIIGIALGALGYVAAFEMVILPSAGTLYLLGVLVLMQRLVFDLYALVAGAGEDGGDGLIPVMIAFLLTLAALPLLALLWGARVTDLTELWARFREGFDIGETNISPTNFLMFVLVFVVGYTLVRLLQGALKSTVLPRTRLDVGGQNAVSVGVGYIGIFLAAVIAITTAGIDLSGLAIVAGALTVGIGFGLQNIVSNFVSGIILLIERPISEGDWIEVGGQMGYVRSISVRSTRIETFDRTDVIVPNADLVSGTVTNFTRGNSVGRLVLPVGVAYGTDTHRVSEVLQEVAESHPMVLLNPKPFVHFKGFGDSSLDFEIRAILRDVNWILNVQTEMNHEIARRFAEEGFEIPFPQRDVWFRSGDGPVAQVPQGPRPIAEAPASPRLSDLDEAGFEGDDGGEADR